MEQDLFEVLREELRARCDTTLGQVREAAAVLEDAVRRANRTSIATEGKRTLDRAFDPLGRQKLVRLSLEALASARASPEVRQAADRIGELARAAPAAARLVLFAYASELVPHPLDGLRTYEDLALRFEQLRPARRCTADAGAGAGGGGRSGRVRDSPRRRTAGPERAPVPEHGPA